MHPEVIVFGGGLGLYLDYFKKGLIDRLRKELPIDIVEDLKIDKAKYGDDSGLMGGCYLIFQDN